MKRIINSLIDFWNTTKVTFFWIFGIDNEMIKMIKKEEEENKIK
jgi:hypothetical protein